MKPLANKTLNDLKHRCQSQLAYAIPLLQKQGSREDVYFWADTTGKLFEVYHNIYNFRYDEELKCPLYWDNTFKRWDSVLNLSEFSLCHAAYWAIKNL